MKVFERIEGRLETDLPEIGVLIVFRCLASAPQELVRPADFMTNWIFDALTPFQGIRLQSVCQTSVIHHLNLIFFKKNNFGVCLFASIPLTLLVFTSTRELLLVVF